MDNFLLGDVTKFSESYFDYLKKIFSRIDLLEIEEFVRQIILARERDSTIFFIGNGGSASTASHFANDLSFGIKSCSKSIKAISLVDNVSIITAIGNDFSYDNIYIKQLKVYAKKDDILVGISASGNSENLIKSFEFANKNNIRTVALTAFDGGILKKIADQCVYVPTKKGEYGPAEDVHMILDHLVCGYLSNFFKKNDFTG